MPIRTLKIRRPTPDFQIHIPLPRALIHEDRKPISLPCRTDSVIEIRGELGDKLPIGVDAVETVEEGAGGGAEGAVGGVGGEEGEGAVGGSGHCRGCERRRGKVWFFDSAGGQRSSWGSMARSGNSFTLSPGPPLKAGYAELDNRVTQLAPHFTYSENEIICLQVYIPGFS